MNDLATKLAHFTAEGKYGVKRGGPSHTLKQLECDLYGKTRLPAANKEPSC